MNKQSNKEPDCVAKALGVGNSLQEIADSDPKQARTLADKLIHETDPDRKILSYLISSGDPSSITKEEIDSFKTLHDPFYAENAAVVTLTACLNNTINKNRER